MGGHLIFRNTTKLVLTWEGDERDENISDAWCHHINKQPALSHDWEIVTFWAAASVGGLKHSGQSNSDEQSNQATGKE